MGVLKRLTARRFKTPGRTKHCWHLQHPHHTTKEPPTAWEACGEYTNLPLLVEILPNAWISNSSRMTERIFSTTSGETSPMPSTYFALHAAFADVDPGDFLGQLVVEDLAIN